MDRSPISQEGYDKLREEVRRLEDDELPRITEAVAEARAEGDLKENAEYHGQREAQGMMQARINSLKTKLSNCYIVDKSTLPDGIVAFGKRVTVKDLKYNEIEKYEFVGPGEEDYAGEILKVLTTSPLAQAMMGKKVGDTAEVQAPRGLQRYEILVIESAE